MSDKDVIQAAYAEVVDGLFKTLFQRYAQAVTPAVEEGALTAFKEGLTIARRARDAALTAAA
jgi:hypothetical protein